MRMVCVCSIDVTEGQLSITLLYLVCALFGSSFWSYEVHFTFSQISISIRGTPLLLCTYVKAVIMSKSDYL